MRCRAPSRLPLALLLLASIAATVAVHGSGRRQDKDSSIPAEATKRKNPLTTTVDIVAGGNKLFGRNCTECHGREGTGIGRAANLRSADVQYLTDGELFWRITNGKPGTRMPSFSRLPEPQRWQIVAFLRTLKAGATNETSGGAGRQ